MKAAGARTRRNDATRDARLRALARIAVGTIFLFRTTGLARLARSDRALDAWPLLGWPDGRLRAPVHALALPAAVVMTLVVVRTCAAVAFTVGVRARVAGLVAAVAGYAVLAQDVLSVSTSIHVLFVAVAALALTDATSAYAIVPDARLGSGQRQLVVVVASIYLWSAIAKLQPEWLSGRALGSHLAAGAFHGRAAVWLERASARAVVAWSVVVLEAAVGALLISSGRGRRSAIVVGLVFHACAEVTVRPDVLGWVMVSLLLACWPRQSQRRVTEVERASP